MKKTTGPVIKLYKSEKILLTLVVLFFIASLVVTVFSNAKLSSSNIEVERMKSKIEKQENVNLSLSMQVDELASLSNIQSVAENYGLSYNNDNIIVIK
ncbi:MAG: cell division protein FtsL [Bacilli bacterium]|nr:cell division protein FtsL [Bacilli bacterium]